MEQRKAILITGASSGIGRKLTERLSREGFFVYAGARKHRDLDALAALPNVHPLQLDVTRSEEIAAAAELVARRHRQLYGLVNNAGVVTLGSVLDGNEAEFDLMMKVNAYGPWRVSGKFARLVVAGRGRIVMISSVAGVLAERNVSAYSMSKHAVEALTDCLAAELEPFGVNVSVVVPGTFHTEIGRNAAARVGADPLMPDFSRFSEPDEVVEAIWLALFEEVPKRRYLIAPDETEVANTIMKQIEQLAELNEGHRYSYSRQSLMTMLDAQLASRCSRPASGQPRLPLRADAEDTY